MRLELLEERTLLSVFTVTDTADSASDPGSLRAALLNAQEGDGIDFDIPTSGSGYNATKNTWTIEPSTPLPPVNASTIDATTEPGYQGSPIVQIDGSQAGSSANGLVIEGGDTTISGLDITGFAGAGIDLLSSGNIVQGDYLGVDSTGTQAVPNDAGVEIADGGTGNLIGTGGIGTGDSPQQNVISGNLLTGVWITGAGTDANVVSGNLIGTDLTGTLAVPDGTESVTDAEGNQINGGLLIDGGAAGNLVGTSGQLGSGDALERNLISGNGGTEVVLDGAGTSGNVVAGNYLGTTASGEAALPNGGYGDGVGILAGADDNWIGLNSIFGPENADQGNVISGNIAAGVYVDSGSSGNVVAGNLIGTDAAGETAVPNYRGVDILGPSNLVGTTGQDGSLGSIEGNVISGNSYSGIEFDGPGATGNVVAGNLIGTSATGTAAIETGDRGQDGIDFFGGPNGNWVGVNPVYGRENADQRNVISGNDIGPRSGVYVDASSSNNVIAGNLIGTDITGTRSIANDIGIYILGPSNRIGTSGQDGTDDLLERNIVAGNSVACVAIGGSQRDEQRRGRQLDRPERRFQWEPD